MKKRLQKHKKTYLILLVFFLGVVLRPIEVSADILDNPDSVIFEKLGHEIGLSNLSVSSIVQDKNGFIWFGTQGGLNMYNSNEMEVYSHNPFSEEGLLNNLIQTIYYDEMEHVIWVGTYQGLSRFDIDSKTFKNYSTENADISNEIIVSITKDHDGNIWFGTLNGLNKIDVTTDLVSTYEVPGEVIRDLLFDSSGNLLIGTYEGLCRFNFDTELVEKVDVELPSNFVMVMDEHTTGVITIGMWAGGVVDVLIDTFEVQDVIIENENVYSLLYSEDDLLYIGTWGNGLFVSKTGSETQHFESTGGDDDLAHPIVYSLFEDEMGLIWIGTNGGGVSLLNKEKSNKVIHTFDEEDENSLAQGKINEIFIDEDIYYYAVYNEGLNVYNPTSDVMDFYQNIEGDETSLSNNNVNTIINYDENHLYLGTNGGIEIFNKSTKEFSTSSILPTNHIVYSLVLKGDILWIGTYQNGVFIYDTTNETLSKLSDFLEVGHEIDNLINEIFIDSKDRIWIGTNNGLNLLIKNNDTYQVTAFFNEGFEHNQLGSDIVKSIFEDIDQNIWISTNGGGISKYNEDSTFDTYTTEEGLSGNIVYGIIQDSNGYLWVSTQLGISKFDRISKVFTRFDVDDGIGGYTFTASGTYYNNILYFGGNHGIVAIPEDYSSTGIQVPKVYITQINVLGESLSNSIQVYNDYEFELAFDKNSVGFQVDSLNYQKSKSIISSYKLIGFDDEYIEFDNTAYVNYSSLPSGSYTFSVVSKMSNSENVQVAEVHFIIANPWYATGIAYVLYALGALGIGFLTVMLWQSRVFKQKNKQLQILNSKLELLTIEDPLTKAYNRRYFETNFKDLLSIAKRSQITFTVMLLDIDGFKLVNDMNGHLAGDEILKQLVKRVKTVLRRSTDFIARIGGDEFIILLFDTNSAGAELLARKIKKAIEQPSSKQEFDITVSAGVVTLKPEEDMGITHIIDLADKQLYKAKNTGKDQISFYSTEDLK